MAVFFSVNALIPQFYNQSNEPECNYTKVWPVKCGRFIVGLVSSSSNNNVADTFEWIFTFRVYAIYIRPKLV